jgi:hypothetical protein
VDSSTFRISHEDNALTPKFMAIVLAVRGQDVSLGKQLMPGGIFPVASQPACTNDSGLQCEVATFVANLPYQQRVALILRRGQQRGYADIAATLGCTEREARETVHETLRSLRAHLGDRI